MARPNLVLHLVPFKKIPHCFPRLKKQPDFFPWCGRTGHPRRTHAREGAFEIPVRPFGAPRSQELRDLPRVPQWQSRRDSDFPAVTKVVEDLVGTAQQAHSEDVEGRVLSSALPQLT